MIVYITAPSGGGKSTISEKINKTQQKWAAFDLDDFWYTRTGKTKFLRYVRDNPNIIFVGLASSKEFPISPDLTIILLRPDIKEWHYDKLVRDYHYLMENSVLFKRIFKVIADGGEIPSFLKYNAVVRMETADEFKKRVEAEYRRLRKNNHGALEIEADDIIPFLALVAGFEETTNEY